MASLKSMSKGFCESFLRNGPPEYFNSLSALFVIFTGVYGLYNVSFGYNISSVWRIIFCMFILNGITSMNYHYTLFFGWKFADEYTMIIAVYLGVYEGAQVMLKKTIIIDKKYFHQQYYPILLNILAFILMVISTISITLLATDMESNDAVAIAFGFAVICILALAYFGTYYAYKKEKASNNEQFKVFFKLLNWILIVTFIAAVSWLGTEPFCKDIKWMQYLHAHVFWHLGSSFAVYGFATLGIFLDCRNNGYDSYFEKGLLPFYLVVKCKNTTENKDK
eukprot:16161_1